MSAEVSHYYSYTDGGQQAPGGGVAPIVSSSAYGAFAVPATGDAQFTRCDNPSKRIPCCCEVFRGATSSAHRGGYHHHRLHHEHQQRHYPEYLGHYKEEGTDGQLSQPHRSSSRRCYCCVPEQEELEECERLAKEKRYQSLRAEREQLKAALYDDLWKGAVGHRSRGMGHRYRPNTAHLLRYSQGTFYQQAVAMEQDRRRQQLRREIKERRRELNAHKHMSYSMLTSTPTSAASRTRMPRSNIRPLASPRGPVVVCTTEGLRRHSPHSYRNQQNAGRISAGVAAARPNTGRSSPQTHVRRQQRGPDQPVKENNPPTGEQRAATVVEAPEINPSGADAATGARPTVIPKREVKKEWQSSPPSPRGVARNKDCCCCHCCRRLCCPCAPCIEPKVAHSAGVMAAANQVAVVPQTQTQPQTVTPTEEKKKEVPSTAQPISRARVTASPRSQSQLTVVDHGRKVYITDDAYLFRRSKVIGRLEQDGYVRRLSPITRSPSAPLPEKTRRWATTRSTSAHRVCV